MSGIRDRFYPAVELLAGAIAVVVWTAAVYFSRGLELGEIAIALSAGLAGAGGAALGALIARSSTKARAAEMNQLAIDASRDALTGLYNRSELFRLLEDALVETSTDRQSLGILFLDLDRFKMVNDTMGHEAGDELLRIVARRLQAAVRSSDVVARLGGDEFVVLCRDLDTADTALALARQILSRFDDPVSLGGVDHRVGTSIGVAVAGPSEQRSADELVRDADAAMYRAKETRSGISFFDDAHRLQIADRQDIERDLRQSLERGELVVHYQPIIDVGSRQLHGFEALVRWNHPERGELGADQFLSIAGGSGMIGWIGDFVLREACAQAARWNAREPRARGVKIGVNLAEPQLNDPNLTERLIEVLDSVGLPPEQLVLEISENHIVDNDALLESLWALRGVGVELAIDDFGTGQSSIGYAKQFEMVNYLKIDEQYVRDMRSGSADRTIVEVMVSMVDALGKQVVAEGVEFEDQLQDLRSLGVPLMQGYLFSRPLPAASIDPKQWFATLPSLPSQRSEAPASGMSALAGRRRS